MKILWSIHLYPNYHLCGAEFYAHNINKYLVSKGHQVRVVLHQADMHNIQTPYVIDGVNVFKPMGSVEQFQWADVIMTHLDFTQWTIQIADIIKRPVVFVSHNTHPYESVRNARRNLNVIYNAKWAQDALQYNWPSMIFSPPVDYRFYNVCENPRDGQYITLINLDENKGGWILKKIAEAMPDKKFLGIMGSYSEPFYMGQCTDMPPNVTILPKQSDIRPIYQQTRILLMLSRYESWGMTATESMCNGIPVIATPTPGLKENLAGAGIYVPQRGEPEKDRSGKIIKTDADNYDINHIVKQINKLDSDAKYYKVISELSRERSRDLDPQRGLAEVEAFLYAAATSIKPVTGPRRPTMI